MSESISSSVGVGDGSSIRPSKFNGKGNFSAWKFKTLAYLQSLGLKEVVIQNLPALQSDSSIEVQGSEFGTVTATNAGTLNSSSNTSSSPLGSSSVSRGNVLKLKSEKAYAIVLNLLEDELIDLVSHVEPGNAHGVWSVLLETYEMKSTATLCHKLDLFMNIRFNSESESFDLFRSRYMKLLSELKEMNEVVSPAIQRYVLLRSLPTKYEALVQSLKINDKISIEEVYTHIKDYYESEKRRRESTDQAAAIKQEDDIVYGTWKQGGRECFICGSGDHMKRDCPVRNRIRCSKCGGTGHVSKLCRSGAENYARREAGSSISSFGQNKRGREEHTDRVDTNEDDRRCENEKAHIVY